MSANPSHPRQLWVTCLSPDSDRLENQLEEAVTLRQDFESSSSKLKALDKQVKALKQEKEEIHKVWVTGELGYQSFLNARTAFV